jgi:hypothetical protein
MEPKMTPIEKMIWASAYGAAYALKNDIKAAMMTAGFAVRHFRTSESYYDMHNFLEELRSE